MAEAHKCTVANTVAILALFTECTSVTACVRSSRARAQIGDTPGKKTRPPSPSHLQLVLGHLPKTGVCAASGRKGLEPTASAEKVRRTKPLVTDQPPEQGLDSCVQLPGSAQGLSEHDGIQERPSLHLNGRRVRPPSMVEENAQHCAKSTSPVGAAGFGKAIPGIRETCLGEAKKPPSGQPSSTGPTNPTGRTAFRRRLALKNGHTDKNGREGNLLVANKAVQFCLGRAKWLAGRRQALNSIPSLFSCAAPPPPSPKTRAT